MPVLQLLPVGITISKVKPSRRTSSRHNSSKSKSSPSGLLARGGIPGFACPIEGCEKVIAVKGMLPHVKSVHKLGPASGSLREYHRCPIPGCREYLNFSWFIGPHLAEDHKGRYKLNLLQMEVREPERAKMDVEDARIKNEDEPGMSRRKESADCSSRRQDMSPVKAPQLLESQIASSSITLAPAWHSAPHFPPPCYTAYQPPAQPYSYRILQVPQVHGSASTYDQNQLPPVGAGECYDSEPGPNLFLPSASAQYHSKPPTYYGRTVEELARDPSRTEFCQWEVAVYGRLESDQQFIRRFLEESSKTLWKVWPY
ncbi:hypothetical protein DFP72DRAFT_1169434 [Ephemerocybe angulata]|uniref:C2H2-type domain-containing protein n=1 Tax=Ephemerocybe angulata TaxID=980116 RepID=A0A8H6I249_9AGAR|nr:hypothetical protein DFP72DRAFT_1169434 [Tulosesus angulatus]